MGPNDNILIVIHHYFDRMPPASKVTYPDLMFQVQKQSGIKLAPGLFKGLCQGVIMTRADLSVHRGRGIVKH